MNRYSRQIAIPEIGKEGQLKLSKAKVLIIGCGALGSMAAMQLAGAGIGTIGIADFDNVDISNLQRQFFFSSADSGKSKVDILAHSMKSLNNDINIISYKEMITSSKAIIYFPDYDFIVDATDNPDSKKMTGDISAQYGKPCSIAGVKEFSGQVMTLLPHTSRLEDFFGIAGADGFLPCSLGGVIGPAAALAASLQACEVIKFFAEAGVLLSGKLFLFNLLNNSFRTFSL